MKNREISMKVAILATIACCACGSTDDSGTTIQNDTETENIAVDEELAEEDVEVNEKNEENSEKTEEIDEAVSKSDTGAEENNGIEKDIVDEKMEKVIIMLEDDGVSGKIEIENGISKIPVITNKSLDYTFQTGDFLITVYSAQLATLTLTTQEYADYFDAEKKALQG